jgi:hypothetical protein
MLFSHIWAGACNYVTLQARTFRCRSEACTGYRFGYKGVNGGVLRHERDGARHPARYVLLRTDTLVPVD